MSEPVITDPELKKLMDEVNSKTDDVAEVQATGESVEVEATEPTEVDKLRLEVMELKELLTKLSDVRAKDNFDSTTTRNSELSAMLKEILAQVIPAAGVGISQAQTEANKKALAEQIRLKQARLMRCAICRQPISACGGPYELDKEGNPTGEKDAHGNVKVNPRINHIAAYVGPRNHRLFKWFQGIIVGGVRYLSDRPGHTIWIPKKSDVLTLINTWENDQEDLLQGRKAEGHGPMGFVGPGQSVNKMDSQQYLGWR